MVLAGSAHAEPLSSFEVLMDIKRNDFILGKSDVFSLRMLDMQGHIVHVGHSLAKTGFKEDDKISVIFTKDLDYLLESMKAQLEKP